MKNNSKYQKILWGIFLIIFLLTLVNLFSHLVKLPGYGDAGFFQGIFERKLPFTRWFLGSAILIKINEKIWSSGTVQSLIASVNMVEFLGAIFMFTSSLIFIKLSRLRLAIILPLLTPLWIMFSSGYNEYYPFIAPIYLGILIWLFLYKPDPSLKTFIIAGVLSGVLPLLYIGFAPLSVLLLFYFLLLNFKKISFAVLAALGTILVCVLRFWPYGLNSFISNLYENMNFGEQYILYSRYLGKTAGPHSLNFSLNYILTLEHFRDTFYMLFFGGGLISLFLLIFGLYLLAKNQKVALIKILQPKPIVASLFILYQTYYLIFMLPKQGPVQDIDLFFSVYLTYAFFAGLVWEKIKLKDLQKFNIKNIFLSASLLYTLIILIYLIRGLPQI